MKILKPGKVEMRKFVCDICGCEFLAYYDDFHITKRGYLNCPQPGCGAGAFDWKCGEPYEEPTPTQSDREKLRPLLVAGLHDCNTYGELTEYLTANGVTFREG